MPGSQTVSNPAHGGRVQSQCGDNKKKLIFEPESTPCLRRWPWITMTSDTIPKRGFNDQPMSETANSVPFKDAST